MSFTLLFRSLRQVQYPRGQPNRRCPRGNSESQHSRSQRSGALDSTASNGRRHDSHRFS